MLITGIQLASQLTIPAQELAEWVPTGTVFTVQTTVVKH
jgi:hypothetical protein